MAGCKRAKPRVGPMHMPFTPMSDRRLLRNHSQLIKNPTVLSFLGAQAGFSKLLELLFKLPQLPYTISNVADVFVQKIIDFATILSGCIFEPQQYPYFIERHIQATAVPDEGKSLSMLIPVDTVITATAARLQEKSRALVRNSEWFPPGYWCDEPTLRFSSVSPEWLQLRSCSIALDSVVGIGFPILHPLNIRPAS